MKFLLMQNYMFYNLLIYIKIHIIYICKIYRNLSYFYFLSNFEKIALSSPKRSLNFKTDLPSLLC